MKKFFLLSIIVLLVYPNSVSYAAVKIKSGYENDPYVVSLVKEINRLQKKLSKYDSEDVSEKNATSKKNKGFKVESQTNGTIDRDAKTNIVTFEVTAESMDLDGNTFTAEVVMNPHVPGLSVKRSCNQDILTVGKSMKCTVKVGGFGIYGKQEYTVKNPRINDTSGKRVKSDLMVTGTLDIR